jgi:SAM-dependent methyltransferase
MGMNLIHRRYCRSRRWNGHLSALLPWSVDGVDLQGADVLELGSGPGLTTDWLADRGARLTAVEYDKTDAMSLAARRHDVTVLHADARALPLPDSSFDAVVCFTMLHHLPSPAAQDELFAQAARVLRPGGIFAGSDSLFGPLFALAHIGDTMTLVDPSGLPSRLEEPGLTVVRTDTQGRALRFLATRAAT